MRIGAVIVAIVILAVSLPVAVWLTQGESPTNAAPAAVGLDQGWKEEKPLPEVQVAELPISEKGPWPQVQISEFQHKFGAMELGDEKSHVFKLTNVGQAPLRLKQGLTTCQCTVSDVPSGEFAPGQTAEIKLTWKPTELASQFEKGATIYTNDPKFRSLNLSVSGQVVTQFMVSPAGFWELPAADVTAPATMTGLVYSSTLRQFEIVAAKSSSPLMTTDIVHFTDQRKAELHATSGYEVRVTVQPHPKVGGYSYNLALKTNVKRRLENGRMGRDDVVLPIQVGGARRGPIQLLAPCYAESKSLVVLGNFLASENIPAEIRMIVTRCPDEGLVIQEAICDPQPLKVELVPIGKVMPDRPRSYILKISYPSGSPRDMRTDSNPGTIVLRTNHPEAKELKLNVTFNAY